MIFDDTQSHEEALPELNCFFISGNRHDKDRIEIQIGFDGLVPGPQRQFKYDADFLVFSPRTLGLFEVEDINNLRVEFQSYLRLHSHTANPKSETSLLRVRQVLTEFEKNPALETLRVFAIEFEAFFKALIKRVRKLEGHSPPPINDIEAFEKILGEFRGLLVARELLGKKANEFDSKSLDHDLILLNEFTSHLHIQFLVEAKSHFEGFKEFSEFSSWIREALKREVIHRKTYNLFLKNGFNSKESENSTELYLRRISLLKKFFQKSLFIAAVGETLQKKLLIPVYAMSAAIAATWAIMIQIYQVRSIQERVGINSILLITVGVTSYVAKDIMKDFFRRYFFSKGSGMFPNYEKKIFVKRQSKKIWIGKIKEFLKTLDNHQIAEPIRRARYNVPGGEIEEFLNEDIFHFRKEVNLDLSQVSQPGQLPWGLREVLRYRFDRLMVSMEDAYKPTHFVDQDGGPQTQPSHRVYHIYFAVRISTSRNFWGKSKAVIKPATKAFRVTLDKTGVLDCQQLDWNISPNAEFL